MKGLPGKFGRPRATERITISVSITFIIPVKGLAVATRENGCAAKRANHVRKIFGIVDLLSPCRCPIHCTWHSYKLQGSAKGLLPGWESFSRALYQYHCPPTSIRMSYLNIPISHFIHESGCPSSWPKKIYGTTPCQIPLANFLRDH